MCLVGSFRIDGMTKVSIIYGLRWCSNIGTMNGVHFDNLMSIGHAYLFQVASPSNEVKLLLIMRIDFSISGKAGAKNFDK